MFKGGLPPCNDIHGEALLKSFQASDRTTKGKGLLTS